VELLLVPQIDPSDADYQRPTHLQLQAEFTQLRGELEQFLNQHALLTTRVQLRAAAYQPVVVHVNLNPFAQDKELWPLWEARLLTKLYRLIHPMQGGRDQKGWPFGRALHIGDIYECLQTGEYPLAASQIRQVRLFTAEATGAARGRALDEIKIDPLTVLISGQHVVKSGAL